MTEQQAYDRIREHFTRPDAQLSKDGSVCYYRSPDGQKCPAGVLIPDSYYEPLMENKKIGAVVTQWPELWPIFSNDGYSFARKAQHLHDSNTTINVVDFIRKLDNLASERGLTLHADA
jgi:hypothetical protein